MTLKAITITITEMILPMTNLKSNEQAKLIFC